ncbi:hypothetical protein [Yersinia frederiksenii]|uniref:hypothetical protein n=1 Tax=Yersinia frederiksenii TaxID=29484 RepID=UPI0005E2549B|nr:hypothetical protein [Yersinia frederiksenii]CNG79490.1 Uncharacterised protein [Yersinia frederiksenii]
MKKYIITRPWIDGQKEGDVVELQKLHPSLVSHVRLFTDNREFEVATPSPEIDELKAALVATEAALKAKDDELAEETSRANAAEAALKAATTKGK